MRYLFIFFLLCFTSTVHAQWIKCPPTRTPFNKNCRILEDLSGHVSQTYSDPDDAHVAHELCHFASSDIRNKLFNLGYRKHNTFYVLNNVAFLVQEPNFKLQDLAKNIPVRYRGQVYNLYLVRQQRDWNDQPSYILDEHTAYTTGTMCAMEVNNMARAQDSGFRMLETLIYSIILKRMAHQKDIDTIVDWQTARCKRLYSEMTVTNPQLLQNYKLLQEILNE